MKTVLFAIFFLFFIVVASSNVTAIFTAREYDPVLEKVTVADWFGVYDWFDLFSVELLENTDYCFDCYTIYKVCNLKGSELSLDDFIVKFYKEQEISQESNIKYLYTESYTEYEPVYVKNEIVGDDKNKTITWEEVLVSNKSILKTRTGWRAFDPASYKVLAEAGCLEIKISGKLEPSQAIDNRISLAGVEISEFAWWNSTFDYRKNFNVTNIASSRLSHFPVLLNITKEAGMNADYSDIRILNASCGNGGNEPAFEFENTTTVRALTWMKVNNFEIGDNPYCMYYGNAAAASVEDKAEVCLLYTSPSPRDATLSRMPSSA